MLTTIKIKHILTATYNKALDMCSIILLGHWVFLCWFSTSVRFFVFTLFWNILPIKRATDYHKYEQSDFDKLYVFNNPTLNFLHYTLKLMLSYALFL